MAMQHNILAYIHNTPITGYWSYAGRLGTPLDFSVASSNTSNTSFTLFWGAPFSLHNTQGLPDISNYILCTNTTYGCRTIPSEPNCTFPNNCTSSITLSEPGPNGKQSTGYDGPIEFSLSVVNGAGNGLNATFVFMKGKEKLLTS